MTIGSYQELLKKSLGRSTIAERIEQIGRHGNIVPPENLKRMLLLSMGVKEPPPEAANVVVLGCYTPFAELHNVVHYLGLLDTLGIDYTCLDRENCCARPLQKAGSKEELDEIMAVARRSIKLNSEAARAKKATNISYYCIGCTHITKSLTVGSNTIKHTYAMDLILDSVQHRSMRLNHIRAGYFEGCHSRFKTAYPEVSLPWEKYRRLLDQVEGLEVVDLENEKCCTQDPQFTLDRALEKGLEAVICPCNACAGNLGPAASSGMRVLHLAEVLLDAVSETE